MNYSFNSRVRYSETGENGKLTVTGCFELFFRIAVHFMRSRSGLEETC